MTVHATFTLLTNRTRFQDASNCWLAVLRDDVPRSADPLRIDVPWCGARYAGDNDTH